MNFFQGPPAARKPARRRRILVALLAVVVVAGGVGAYASRKDGSATDSKPDAPATLEFQAGQIARPAARRLSYDLVLPGTVQAISQATVRSRLSAVVQQVNVREGDAVRAGQVLAEFDSAPLRAQLAERRAGLASAKANLDQAQRTRDSNAQLVQRSFITQNAFDAADAAFQTQVANMAAAQAQVDQVQLQLDDAQVHAPIAGRIARRYVQPGEKVGQDAQLFSIVDLTKLEVQAQAAASDAARVQSGAAAAVQVEGLSGQLFRGRVDRINPSADPGSRTIDLYVSFPNERELVRAGMFAGVRLHLEADRDATTLPLTAVRSEGGQSIIWTIKDGRLARHVVSIGRRDESAQLVEILGGAEAGDQVLATRFDNLKDGGPARIVAAGSAGAAPAAAAAR
jgi:RND family efflux transporter MFP subunit